MEKDSKIYVAGHNGLVGSAIVRKLKEDGYKNILTFEHKAFDLREKENVNYIFDNYKIDYVFLAAAKVGGINYNKKYPADFIYDNLMIQTNIVHKASLSGVKKLCFLGSACIYPKFADVPIKEEYLLTDVLEETNIAYAIAKIAGYYTCKKYTEQYGLSTISVMPNNLYGIRDNFNIEECHVIPSFIRKFIDAKEKNEKFVECWGDGSPTREFLFSDDLADALIFLMNNYNESSIINIGPEREVSISELAHMISNLVDYKGEIIWDKTKPNGTPRRALDTSKMKGLGWKSKTSLNDGLKITIDWFLKNRDSHARI